MNCKDHPSSPAAAVCTRCDQLVCRDCARERNSRIFCPKCLNFLDSRRAALAPELAIPEVIPPAPVYGYATASGQTPIASLAKAAALTEAPPLEEIYSGEVAPAGLDEPLDGTGRDPFGSEPSGIDQVSLVPSDLYEGEAPEIPGPAAVAVPDPLLRPPTPPGVAATERAVGQGSLGRGAAWAALAGLLCMVAWYAIALLTEKNFAIVAIGAIGIGWLVGLAAARGAGRGGTDIALLSVVIALVAMLGGDYLILKQWVDGAEAEEAQRLEELRQSIADGISDDEVIDYRKMDPAEFEKLSRLDVRRLKESLQAEATEEAALDEPPEAAGLSPVAFLLAEVLRPLSLLIFGAGAFQAYRIPARA